MSVKSMERLNSPVHKSIELSMSHITVPYESFCETPNHLMAPTEVDIVEVAPSHSLVLMVD